MMRWAMRAAAILAIATFTACSDDPTGTVLVARVEVGPSNQVVVVGDTTTVTAVAVTADGDIVPGPVLWRSLNPTIATVLASGGTAYIVGKAPGTARIEAESGGRAGYVDVTIAAAAEVASVELLPASLVLEVGQELAIQARAKAANGSAIGGRAVTWTITPGGAAAVTPQVGGWATITAHTEGEAVIRATIDGVYAETEVQVVTNAPPPAQVASVIITPTNFSLPVNHETSLQAIAKDANGEMIFGRPVTWTSTAPAVAVVTPIGVSPFANLQAKAAGTVVIRATIDGVAGEVTVQVTGTQTPPPGQVLHLAFTSYKRGIWVDQVHAFKYELVAQGVNGPIADPVVTWAVEDSTILSVDATGNVRGLRAGTTKLLAVSGGQQAAMYVTVFQSPGGVAVFDLTYDWWDGQWHMPPRVGREPWTDANGQVHEVDLYVSAGSLTMTGDGQYERVLTITGWVTVNGAGVKAIERQEVDRGTSGIIVGGETGYRMYSTTTPGYEYVVVGAYNAGHATMRAVIGTASEHEYLFRLRQ